MSNQIFSSSKKLATAKQNNPWNVTDHIPVDQFVINSHRGAGILALENTMEAMEISWNLGTYPEADLRMTRDQVIFCLHDINLKGSPSGEIDLSKLTWKEVLDLEIGKSKH